MTTIRRRSLVTLATGMTLALTLAACGGGGDNDNNAAAPGGDGDTDCAAFEKYGDLSGTTVSVYTSIIAPEDQPHIDSYKPFEECTGATINYEGSKEFEAQLLVKLQSGAAPDIAYIPQPGLLKTIVESYPDSIVPASGEPRRTSTNTSRRLGKSTDQLTERSTQHHLVPM